MSNEILTNVWKFAPCKDAELVILLSLADQANDNGICWPGLKSLMDRSRASRTTVYRVVKMLEDKNIITEIRRGEPGFPSGKFTSKVWRILPVEEWEPLMSDGDEVSQFETSKDRQNPVGGIESSRGWDKNHKRTSIIKTPTESYDGGTPVVLKSTDKWNSPDLAKHFANSVRVQTKSISAGNVTIMAKFFAAKKKEGIPAEEMKLMVDIFFLDYERFNGGGIEPWRAFIANSAILQTRARRKMEEKLAVVGGESYWLDTPDEPIKSDSYWLD